VKSLIRFKCVCKTWFSLISDPHFTNSHFQLTTTTPTRRILFISSSDFQIRSVDLEASLHDDSTSASLNLDFLRSESYYDIEIKGSCRGFILFHCASSLYLWNPSTGFHKQIPLSPFGSNLNIEHFYGFGYDQSTDDYLVVLMSYGFGDDQSTNHYIPYIPSNLEFFSLRDNTWKEIECPDHYPCSSPVDDYSGVGSLCNGAIHWLAFRDDLEKDVIVSFDLTERKLLDIDFPVDYYSGFICERMDCGLWVFGEFLSLCAKGYRNTTEIWVMKEYQVNSSWTKTHIFSNDILYIWYFSPICCTKSGDIIGRDGGTKRLVKYDDNGQLLEHCSNCKDSFDGYTMYTDSLLSLPGGNEKA